MLKQFSVLKAIITIVWRYWARGWELLKILPTRLNSRKPLLIVKHRLLDEDNSPPFEPVERYECSCGLEFKFLEAAIIHLKETFDHSVKKVIFRKIDDLRFAQA